MRKEDISGICNRRIYFKTFISDMYFTIYRTFASLRDLLFTSL